MIKAPDGTVTFTVHPDVGGRRAVVCGDWNGWSHEADVMAASAGGGFSATVTLVPGHAYRFKYLIDGHRWENDWSADAYVANDYGGEDSVVDLTGHGAAGSKKAAPKKAAAKKAAAPAKKAAVAPAKKAAVPKKKPST